MTRYFFVLITAILLQLLPVVDGMAMEGIVIKVIDGDSIKVLVDGVAKEVRLYGIDTPEHMQSHSYEAKQFTRQLAQGQYVRITVKDFDRYGRVVGKVRSRGKMVNRELVRKGLAWFYPRYCLEQPLCKELKRLETEARAKRFGLWEDPSPVAPWDWKHRKRSGMTTNWAGLKTFVQQALIRQ